MRTMTLKPRWKLNNPNVKLVFMFLLVGMMVFHVFHRFAKKKIHRIEHTTYWQIGELSNQRKCQSGRLSKSIVLESWCGKLRRVYFSKNEDL